MPQSGVTQPDPLPRVAAALAARSELLHSDHTDALRLFNGHLEGDARFVIDRYGSSVVIFHDGDEAHSAVPPLVELVRDALPSVTTVITKARRGSDAARRGQVVELADGARPATSVREDGVRYAVDLLMHQDAGFYLDTRELRRWLRHTSNGRHVLNTFAYTGSLGVAAQAGGAARVVHTDLNRRYLNVAKTSATLNGFAVDRRDYRSRDFYAFVRAARLSNERFDTVILDPPFFSSTDGGRLDLNRDSARLINKVRPLVRDGGQLVVVNNALFVSGSEFMRELEALCEGGWLRIDTHIDVPSDITGFAHTRVGALPVDPTPFNHSTKIAVLTVRHRS